MARSKEMQDVVDKAALKLFGRSHTQATKQCVCVMCGGDASVFTDALSRKEYSISGMCQKCQDKVFDDPEYEIDNEHEEA